MSRQFTGQNFAHRFLWNTSALSVLMGTALLGTAHAQSAPANQNTAETTRQNNVKPVVVTPERRSQRLIDVPAAISVVSSADIKDKHLISLSDIAYEVPNVVLTGSSLFPNPTIRGVGSAS